MDQNEKKKGSSTYEVTEKKKKNSIDPIEIDGFIENSQ